MGGARSGSFYSPRPWWSLSLSHTHTKVATVLRDNNCTSSNEKSDGHFVTADFLFQELTKAHSNRQDKAARERGRVMLAEAHAECQVQVGSVCVCVCVCV
jgi:hypothetical protein